MQSKIHDAVADQGRPPPPPPTDKEVSDVELAVTAALDRHAPELIAGLRNEGWWASDAAVLPMEVRWNMRGEVEALWKEGQFQTSQSVRGTEYYDKEHVFATEIGADTYETAPRLVHYTVSATRALAACVQKAFPEVRLSNKFIGNKLNFSTGQGATFDAHLDLGVVEKPFNRKLTLLLYLNAWRSELGGQLTILGEGSTEAQLLQHPQAGLPVSLEPFSGRWVAFWSDRMLHKVEASEAPRGISDYRASYTIWLCSEDGSATEAPKASSNEYETAPTFASF